MIKIWTICFVLIMAACNRVTEKNTNDIKHKIQNIKIEISDSTYKHIDQVLHMESYVKLSSKVPLGKIERIVIRDNNIYILDSQPKIVCYNLKGELKYIIDKKGKGPGEFLRILDFTIDTKNKKIVLYDSSRKKLLFFRLNDGCFTDETDVFFSPNKICSHNDFVYYYNPHKIHYPKNKEFHFSLLISKNYTSITKTAFPFDEVVSEYWFGFGNEFPFYYNDEKLLFIKRFEDIIYELDGEKQMPRYKLELDNHLPEKYLKTKPDGMDLINSGYSFGIENAYIADHILYFSFTKGEKIIFCLYNLKNNSLIYCGPRIWPIPPTMDTPFFYPIIRGVYNGLFYSLISPSVLIETKLNNKFFPKDLKSVTDYDNPIIAFYKVKN